MSANRGQLVLAGSVAIAVAILAVGVVLNAGTYAGAVAGNDHTVETVGSARAYERTANAGLERLVTETGDDDAPPTEAALRRNVSTFHEQLALSAARSAGATLGLRLDVVDGNRYVFVYTFDTPDLRYRTTVTVEWGPP